MTISNTKMKVMAYHGLWFAVCQVMAYLFRTKILLENKPTEQVSHFNYLGYDTSFKQNRDEDNKLRKTISTK